MPKKEERRKKKEEEERRKKKKKKKKKEERRKKKEERRKKKEERRKKGPNPKPECLMTVSSKQRATCLITLWPLIGMSDVLFKNEYEGPMVKTEGARDV